MANPLPWSPDQVERLRELSPRLTVKAVAQDMGLTTQNVAQKQRALGLPSLAVRKPGTEWSPEMDDLLRSMTATGKKNCAQMGAMLGSITSSAVMARIRYLEIDFISPAYREPVGFPGGSRGANTYQRALPDGRVVTLPARPGVLIECAVASRLALADLCRHHPYGHGEMDNDPDRGVPMRIHPEPVSGYGSAAAMCAERGGMTISARGYA